MTRSFTRRPVTRRLFMVGVALPVLLSIAQAQDAPQPELPRQKLVIVTHDGKRHDFQVEVALTPDQQTVGLMFRPSVPADGGMLFDWGAERPSQMWMKNTIASLDMLFISADGHVRSVAERTVPQSLAVIDGRVPVRATLELAAGTAEALDIRVGDLVEAAVFGNLK